MPDRTLLRAALLEDPAAPSRAPGALLIEGERIAARWALDAPPPPDAAVVDVAGSLAPGLIDVHYHGDLVLREPHDALSALRAASASLARHGVTAFLPTTVAWPAAELPGRIAHLVDALAVGGWPGAVPLGLHLEGPWIRAEAAGAQPAAGIRPYAPAEGRALFDRAGAAIRMVTLAPELDGAPELQEELVRRSITIAIGHTLADPSSIDAAIAGGARHATHLFNAMGALHQRGPGVAGRVLGDDRLSCDVIADGAHVHCDWLRVAARAKGERLILISDRIDASDPAAVRRSGFGSGPMHSDGVAWRLADGRLAGSHLWLDDAVRNVAAWRVMDRHDAIRACTLGPARLLGIEAERGTLRAGARADFAVFDRTGQLQATWVGGRPLPLPPRQLDRPE
jgi:N-acetylglucosamine-6-phosphate deacetylase